MKNGYFDNLKREFVITNMRPRRHLNNYLWNEETVCTCDHFGFGTTWFKNGYNRRVIESGPRNVYIKDKKTGEYYSANRNYNDLPFDIFEAHVGMGYHKVCSEYKGVYTDFTILIPVSGNVSLFKVLVKNTSKTTKELGMYFTLNPEVHLTWHSAYGYGIYREDISGFEFDHTAFAVDNEYKKIYIGSNELCASYEVDEERFRGPYNGYHNPAGVISDKLESRGNDFSDKYISAFQFDVCLKEGEEKGFYFVASAVKDEKGIKEIKEKYLKAGVFEKELELQNIENEKYLDVFQVETPDEYLNSQANIWLKRQVSLGKSWGRVYGKGYRDVMQDITAFVSFDTALARKRILYALKYQYEDGNPIRMFEPNLRYPYNDCGVWMTGAILSYLNESGDLSILDEKVTYLLGTTKEKSSLKDEHVYEPYEAGTRADNSVYDHVKAAIDYLVNCKGEHGLVLWLGGDWNDSLNNAGVQGKGESVWLTIATVNAINEFIEILNIIGNKADVIEKYQKEKEKLISAINKFGKYDGRYIYGINDYGEIVGGKDRLFLNTQTWAVLAGVDKKEVLERVMDKVEENLKCDFGYIQCYPSWSEGSDKIGRISYFRPGLIENGSVYNHGVAFKIVADCILKRNNNAYNSLKLISCDNPKNLDSGVEPYAVSNMYIGPEDIYNPGYAPMSWITGTAGWLYRCISEFICGVKPTVSGLKLDPCFPNGWNNIKVTRKFRDNIYNITYIKSGEKSIVCDDKKVDILPIGKRGTQHNVVCCF